MVKYHPDTRFLTDYTAGSLPRAQALCVATHLHYCAGCKLKVRELLDLGSELFLQQVPVSVEAANFERLLARVDKLVPSNVETKSADVAQQSATSTLPKPLQKIARGNLENLKWRRIGKHFRYTNLKIDPQRETQLLHIRAGGSLPHHRHRADEITVVITGSFSDQDDKYMAGDFIVRTSGEQHRPVASQDEDCLCLSTLDAPIVMSNWFYRLLQPLL